MCFWIVPVYIHDESEQVVRKREIKEKLERAIRMLSDKSSLRVCSSSFM
jgi:hypothetical protein